MKTKLIFSFLSITFSFLPALASAADEVDICLHSLNGCTKEYRAIELATSELAELNLNHTSLTTTERSISVFGNALNDRSEVTGTISVTDKTLLNPTGINRQPVYSIKSFIKTFFWSNGKFKLWDSTTPYSADINNASQIISSDLSKEKISIYNSGKQIFLTPPTDSGLILPLNINNRGDILALALKLTSQSLPDGFHSLFWRKKNTNYEFDNLETLLPAGCVAQAVNDAASFAGVCNDASSESSRFFVQNKGAIAYLPSWPKEIAVASLNDKGSFTANWTGTESNNTKPLYYDGAILKSIPPLSGTKYCWVRTLNNREQMVGACFEQYELMSIPQPRPFVYDTEKKIRDLRYRTQISSSGDKLTYPQQINDRGEILVWAESLNGKTPHKSFLLIPNW